MSNGSLTGEPVADVEQLARVVHFNSHVRKSDGTARPEAFLPYKHVELSVIRHRNITESELWTIGAEVAARRKLPLIGRADLSAFSARQQRLDVKAADEPPRNHANIVGWPTDKPAQLDLAQQLAAASSFMYLPDAS